MGDGSGTGVYGALITNKSTSEVSGKSVGKRPWFIIKKEGGGILMSTKTKKRGDAGKCNEMEGEEWREREKSQS